METKREYIEKLRNLLLWKYDSKEVIEILHDYSEFFDIGIEQGKTEIQLCQDLGNPIEVVRALKLENTKKGFLKSFTQKALFRIFGVILSLYLVYHILWNPVSQNMLLKSIAPFLLIFIWCVLGGKSFCLMWLSKESEQKFEKKLLFSHCILFISAILLCVMVEGILKNIDIILHWNIEPVKIGPFCYLFLQIFGIGNLCIMLWAVYQYRRYSILYYSVFCHSAGLFCSILECIHVIRRMDISSLMPSHMLWEIGVYNPYITCIIFTAIFLLYCICCKKGEIIWMHK